MVRTAESCATAASDELMTRITEAVATSSGVESLALPPLERTIDPEAIEALVDGDGLWDFTFSYHGHIVTVDGDGQVRASTLDEW